MLSVLLMNLSSPVSSAVAEQEMRPYRVFFPFLLLCAQRRFIANESRLRAAGVMPPRFLTPALLFPPAMTPPSAAIARSSRSRSFFNSATIPARFTV
jgi:hypothetical protein